MPPSETSGTPCISLIAAVARNGVIGRGNALPWRLPEDLKRFKALTTGHPVIMGRKTFESIGRPLPNRRNVVVSRDRNFAAAGCEIAVCVADALAACATSATEIFVIGGAQIYEQSLPFAHRLYLTEIQEEFDGDARFPEWDDRQWREASREHHIAASGMAFDFVIYERTKGGK